MTVTRASQFPVATPAKKRFRRGLRFKAIGIAMLLGTLPVLIVGAAAYQIVKFETGRQVENLQQTLALGLYNKINLFMRDRYGDIQVMAGLDIFTDPKLRDIAFTADKEAALQRLQRAYPIYDSIGLFDENGDVIAQTAGEFLGNYRDRSFVREALAADKPILSQPLISSSSGISSIYSVAPVKDKTSDEVIGFICARLPVSSFARFISSLGQDKVNQYFLTDRDGNIFLSSQGDHLVPATPNDVADGNATSQTKTRALTQVFPELRELQANERTGNVLGRGPIASEKQLLTYIPSFKTLTGLPELGWGVTLAIDTDVAFAAQQQLLRTLVGGMVIAAVVVAIAAVLLADRATRPILSATETVVRLGQGQLGARVTVSGADEVAQLGANINQMAERIQALVAEIESSNAAEIQQQNDLLQSDVRHILAVVSAVEEGDLTVRAQVSDRATGSVSDTLNRLIEGLSCTMSAVVSTTHQVDRHTLEVGNVAATTVRRAQAQATSLSEVQGLMENVNALSQDTMQQTTTADAAARQMQAAVAEGQRELTAMLAGIASLQAGTGQIARRSQALTDFVDLAAQFTHNQKRIAALTRVLALNASMLASRASAQQDPQQFASIVREFETISKQVNDLAVETSRSLAGLKQRSEQVQTVVSGLDSDIGDIGAIVGNFAQEAGQSRQAFDRVREATEQVACVSQQIASSSQGIATAAQTTLQAVQEIATSASDTEYQANITQEQLDCMKRTVNSLQDLVQFFHLSPTESIAWATVKK